ncbi:hypothetical protein [Algivirga pacifica]|uniref:Uncharacterized protein n=1 Tax=Algivirga pacifica TaxID=1162670 RepID=A0ABP9DAF3_9BACT
MLKDHYFSQLSLMKQLETVRYFAEYIGDRTMKGVLHCLYHYDNLLIEVVEDAQTQVNVSPVSEVLEKYCHIVDLRELFKYLK